MGQSENKWQETSYLSANLDVRKLVESGVIPDGYYHWMTHGRFKGRTASGGDWSKNTHTRLCYDPWENIEFAVDGTVKPCCMLPGLENLTEWESLEELRNSEKFRAVRHGLLSGDLHENCRNCHTRKMVPVQQQMQHVTQLQGKVVPLLDPAPLWAARVDINTECNLRCVYCAVSQPGYEGSQMRSEKMDQLVGLLSQYPDLASVSVNGHGETTSHPQWKEFCLALLDRNLPLTMITNLGRKFESADFDVLSQFKSLEISIDSADEHLLRAVRRKVELSRIVYNIGMIRTRAAMKGHKAPCLSFSCGLYDRNIEQLEEFAWFAVTQGIANITFWNLVKYPDIHGATTVRTLESLDDESLARAIESFDRAMAVFNRFQVQVKVAGDFVTELRKRVGQTVQSASDG